MIAIPPLYVIADADVCARAGWTLETFIAACLDGGAQLLQLRVKSAGSREFLDVAAAVVARAAKYAALIIVNDRVDIARLAGAGGVHVGQDDLAPADVRTILGPAAVVGVSTHTTTQIDAAIQEPVSYIAVGPVFTTTTKDTGYSAVGLERLQLAARAAAARQTAIVAIGGITLARAPETLAAGATSVAVISDLLATGDPAARVRAYLDVLAV